MRTIVLYSTRTGNTKKVAEAIAGGLPAGTPCVSVTETPEDLAGYDCVFIGYWVDRGTADKAAQDIIKVLSNKHVAIFATLGADPKSEHAAECLKNGEALLPEGKKADGLFICQGAVDPKLIEMMYQKFPAGHPHGRTPEREALHAEAAKHPDAADLADAKAFAEDVMKRIEAEV
ncbi:MAG: flavodoxin family protein [Megasphaera cerevisiae]|jgi:flavodoxin|nr:flavodoxin family protein [Megasphaera cerevisiae]